MMEAITTLPVLPPRSPESNKGSFGRVLVVAGSRGMSGAAVLAASAALRAGAGLVRVAIPFEVWPAVAIGNPCYTTLPLTHDKEGKLSRAASPELVRAAAASDVVALGPGLGRSAELGGLLEEVLARVSVPIVLDADGLNNFIDHPDRLGLHAGPLVITPHPGEFARLVAMDTARVQAARQELAGELAQKHRLFVVLKGHATVVTDGARLFVNTTGNPGMATAGSGDVLTGMIAAFVGQGLDPFQAAQLGVYLHGLAGDLARDELGEESLVATDLIEYLPRAFRAWRNETT
ncbi:MAG: NAD(P)H-hydrate dehydratase [Gemmataceae bacterium]|nr:NAD(P)H-hydrate dehydratase [Gemmataceae bacterium]MCI0739581.1 NAD(P)H-hydrate dehydratase [Gemmataceae bacterium]